MSTPTRTAPSSSTKKLPAKGTRTLRSRSGSSLSPSAFYETGQVVEKDVNKARHYYQMAANAGNSMGLYNLGIAQMNDKTQDSKLRSHIAMEYMQKAAHGGNDRAKDFISKFGGHFISVLNSAVPSTDPESASRDEPREQGARREHNKSKVRLVVLAKIINEQGLIAK